MTGAADPPVRVVAVGLGSYDRFVALPGAEPQARAVATAFGDRAAATQLVAAGEDALWAALKGALPRLDPGAGAAPGLILYWAGHGYLLERSRFCLAAVDTDPAEPSRISLEDLADLAARTGAGQVLLVIDACYAGAGVGEALRAAEAIISEREQYGAAPTGFSVLASAMDWQRASDDLFGPRFIRLLTEGPTTEEHRERWNPNNALIHAEDVIRALIDEWPAGSSQRPSATVRVSSGSFIPNPLYATATTTGVVGQLVDAALGSDPGENGRYFTGREDLITRLCDLVKATDSGLYAVTGPPGCGKSAVLGWLACWSDPVLRAQLLSGPAKTPPDLVAEAIDATVVARSLSPSQLVRALDLALSGRLLPAGRAGRRGIGELVDAVRAADRRPVIVVDGLDEAGTDAWTIAADVLRPLGAVALVLVGTRDLTRTARVEPHLGSSDQVAVADPQSTSLVTALAPEPDHVLQLLALVDDEADVRRYVLARLRGVRAELDPDVIVDYVTERSPEGDAGGFLFARLVTAQLREFPIDTSDPAWRDELGDSVDDSFRRTLSLVGPMPRAGGDVPTGADDLLTGLAWAAGRGVPDDVWAAFATAVADDPEGGRTYQRTDVFWTLGPEVAGRFVVTDGNGTQAVFRLAQRELADHLLARLPDDLETAVRVATAAAQMMAALVASGHPPESHAYLWEHLWVHCAQAGPAGITLLEGLERDSPGTFVLDLALGLEAQADGLAPDDLPGAAVALRQSVDWLRRLEDGGESERCCSVLTKLGLVLRQDRRLDEAQETMLAAAELARTLAEQDNAAAAQAADTLAAVSLVLRESGDLVGSVSTGLDAVELYRRMVEGDPTYRVELANALNTLGLAYRDAGRPDEAIRAVGDATAAHQELAAANPAFRGLLATSLNNLGLVRMEAGQLTDALEPATQAVVLAAELAEEDPVLAADQALALSNLGMLQRALGRVDAGVVSVSQAADIYRDNLGVNPECAVSLARVLSNLGLLLRESGDRVAGLARAEEAEVITRDTGLTTPEQRSLYALVLGNLALAYADAGQPDEALARGEQSVAAYAELFDDDPDGVDAQTLAAQAQIAGNLSLLLRRAGRVQPALAYAERALELHHRVVARNRVALPDYFVSAARLALAELSCGQTQDAARTVQVAMVQLRSFADPIPTAQQPTSLRAALADVISAAATVFARVQIGTAVTLAEEAVGLYRGLAGEQRTYRGPLVNALLYLIELAHFRGDGGYPQPAEVEGLLGEAAELVATFGPGGTLVNGLTELTRVGALSHDRRVPGWAEQGLQLLAADPGHMSFILRAQLTGGLASVLSANGDGDVAITRAQEAVAWWRRADATTAMPTQVVVALIDLATVAGRAGRTEVGLTAAADAVATAEHAATDDPLMLPVLARAVGALADATRATGADAGAVWSEALTALPDDRSRLGLLVSRMDAVAVDLVAGHGWAENADPLSVVGWRTRCRAVRAADPSAFAAAWVQTGQPEPAWLIADPQLFRIFEQWLAQPSLELMYAFHEAHLTELGDPGVGAVIDEVATVNPTVAEFHRDLLHTVATGGLELAYRPVRLQLVLGQFLASDPATWPELLRTHATPLSDLALARSVADTMDVPDDRALDRLRRVLRLAEAGLVDRCFASLTEPETRQALLLEIRPQPELALAAVAVILELGHLDLAARGRVELAHAIALTQLGRVDEATALATELVRADPGSSPAILSELIGLVAAVPSVAALLPVFNRPGPG
ncbi:MAG TPA: tetratricopeptide repeat protein [Propionibacteriaceae bacterium]